MEKIKFGNLHIKKNGNNIANIKAITSNSVADTYLTNALKAIHEKSGAEDVFLKTERQVEGQNLRFPVINYILSVTDKKGRNLTTAKIDGEVALKDTSKSFNDDLKENMKHFVTMMPDMNMDEKTRFFFNTYM